MKTKRGNRLYYKDEYEHLNNHVLPEFPAKFDSKVMFQNCGNDFKLSDNNFYKFHDESIHIKNLRENINWTDEVNEPYWYRKEPYHE